MAYNHQYNNQNAMNAHYYQQSSSESSRRPSYVVSPQDLMTQSPPQHDAYANSIAPRYSNNNYNTHPAQPTYPASQPRQQSFSEPRPEHPLLPAARDIDGLGALVPGALYSFPAAVLPTAQSILDRSYAGGAPRWTTLVIVPRRPEYTGSPSLPMIVFNVRGSGRVGISLRELRKLGLEGGPVLEDEHDRVWHAAGWKKTTLTIDWPGIPTTGEHMPCTTKSGAPCTRADVARRLAINLIEFFKGGALKWGDQTLESRRAGWDLRTLRSRDVRLIGISYYRKSWIPVFSMDIEDIEERY